MQLYISLNHPFQVKIRQLLGEITGVSS